MPTIRTSSLPILWQCAASAHVTPETPINETGDAATLGTAAHVALAGLAESGALDWDAVPAVAQRFGVDAAELRILCALGRQLWESVAESFPAPLTEVALSAEIAGVTLTGHVDLISVAETTARLGDWKTGRLDSNYTPQLQGYAALALLDNPELTECTATVLWVRDREIENYTMTRDGLSDWVAEFDQRVARWDGVYRPGAHCRYCPLSHECNAANALARRDVAAMLDTNAAVDLTVMEPEQIVTLARLAGNVSSIAYRVREAIKAHVLATGDIRANGSRLTIQEETRRELRPTEAWPVLTAAGFGDEEFASCMRLSMKKAEEIVGKRAGRGKGAGAKRTLAADLEAAGAIETKTIAKLVTRRA